MNISEDLTEIAGIISDGILQLLPRLGFVGTYVHVLILLQSSMHSVTTGP